jgi:hypothetical protein
MGRTIRGRTIGGKCERILDYLERAEWKASDPWEKDDLRVAWKCVLNAATGVASPWDTAFATYYGKPLAKALAYWAERDRLVAKELAEMRINEAARQAQPKQLTLDFSGASSPKKPPQRERRRLPRKDEAA